MTTTKMKSIFFAVAAAALVGAAIASCPNACSGHGSCGNHDRCNCYANFVGGDCSEKSCPYGRSGAECSGRGTCDRGSGTCECSEGYSGASCQRVSCPNDCSGKGSCDTTTGMCQCAGGYAGNDCGKRLCPKGDDPLTHEVENSGDGSASQGDEVQTVTFSAGRGLGGSATLTYHDLYGQAWTTRPFVVGGDNVYRLEIAVVPATANSDLETIKFTYNGATSAAEAIHAGAWDAATASITAEKIRAQVTSVLDASKIGSTAATSATSGLSAPFANNDRASVVYVRKHHSATSVKIGGSIHAAARITFDIYLPIDMSTHDDNGGLLSGLGVAWGSTPAANTAYLSLNSLGDRSDAIADALTSLPNQVIPSVTVSKVDVTDYATTSTGAYGNALSQSYTIRFSDAGNAGDQNMLQCNAAPCDESGCINRGPGVSETRYMYHSHANDGEGINFNNRGYFIMDVGNPGATDTNDAGSTGTLSAGSIKINWDTGAGIDSAVFAIVATASEVQTALRTITGWEAVTVALWGSRLAANHADGAPGKYLVNHQFKVTFPAGYDDLGKSPTFETLGTAEGYAAPSPAGATAQLYDQRFSNSVWIGKTTGYSIFTLSGDTAGTLNFAGIEDASLSAIDARPQNGDVWVQTDRAFGAGGINGAPAVMTGGTTKGTQEFVAFDPSDHASGNLKSYGLGLGAGASKTNFAYLKEGATSQQSSDYFAVGSTIEVLGTGKLGATSVNNQYRKFKVTGHVTNSFNKEFAKLDSFPADDGTTSTFLAKDYLLKITGNNGTVHNYDDTYVRVNVNEVQVIVIGAAGTGSDEVFTLNYKGEESEDLNHASTAQQVAEEINGFSALSGPVTVTKSNQLWTVTFDAKDGDVALLGATLSSGTGPVTTFTKHHGWSIEAPIEFGLDTMQAGGLVNISAAEICTFEAETAAPTNVYFCYSGVCGAQSAGMTGANLQSALLSIRDDNGVQLLGSVAAPDVSVTRTYKITLPSSDLSCDKLEMRSSNPAATTSGYKKTVQKHNNGKQFGITRSFLHHYSAGAVTGIAADQVTITEEAADKVAVAGLDSIIISDVNGCDAHNKAAGDDVIDAGTGAAGDGTVAYPIVRRAMTIATASSATKFGSTATMADSTSIDANGGLGADSSDETALPQVWLTCDTITNNGRYRLAANGQTLLDFHTGAAVTTTAITQACTPVAGLGLATGNTAKCGVAFGRHVITLDSMPTESLRTVKKALRYTSPVGGCSVEETTKGTYESYECSNRGACDGKSGVCQCYEGYSGQSCQTQTVLV